MKLWLKREKLRHFIKEPLRDYQRLSVFTILALAVLEIADELILAHNENRPPNLRKVMGHTVDSVTLMGRVQKQISAERKERLKPVLNEDIRALYGKGTSYSKYILARICWKEWKRRKNLLKFQTVLSTTPLPVSL